MNAKILVVLPTSNFLHRQILEGILEHSKSNGPWQFHLVTGDDFEQGFAATVRWGATGIIALVRESAQMKRLFDRRLPSVFLNPPAPLGGHGKARPPQWSAFVNRDQEGVGRTAADYFLDRGYTSFAFVGSAKPAIWSTRRLDGFRKRIDEAGGTLIVYDNPTAAEQADFAKDVLRMRKWLEALPPQTAVFCARDRRAQQLLGVCLDAGIAVPQTLAVLGSDNDAILCEATTPSLSSISLDGKQVGLLCARLLDDLMHRRKTSPFVNLVLPRVVTRQSTDASAIRDSILAKALKDIRDNLDQPVSIEKLAVRLGYSKRTLELKAKKTLGCTFRDEVTRIRLNEAVRLLANTELSVQEIALKCGFCCASHLGTRIRQAFKRSPSSFRATNHITPAGETRTSASPSESRPSAFSKSCSRSRGRGDGWKLARACQKNDIPVL